MPPQFYAHTSKLPNGETNPDQSTWEPLFTSFEQAQAQTEKLQALHPDIGHLNKVAHLAGNFAQEMFAKDSKNREIAQQWAYLAGLWHDLGKFTPQWQQYLATKADPHQADVSGTLDHSTAGAQFATSKNPLGHLIASAIAGHHGGLPNARSTSQSCLERRLLKELDPSHAPAELTSLQLPPAPHLPASSFQNSPAKNSPGFTLAFFQRMLFSCIVDADFLATEAFMNPKQARQRPQAAKNFFAHAIQLLEQKLISFGKPAADDPVAQARAQVSADCAQAAEQTSGIFTLTVPTGGGKTLSSLNFALRHALKHGKTRIIYVIPFTSIIEQNAAVFREVLTELGEQAVLEHHSNLLPETQSETSRLATENWDAPLIITTAVQFYESLFAAKTSQSRKLHNIANSVIILDEAQCLPVQYLAPCLRVLEELSNNYQTSIVLCTATQPSVAQSPEFPIGFPQSQEIIQDPEALFQQLARVKISYRGKLVDKTLAQEISQSKQALCIVNTRAHARKLFKALPKSEENFHLSTRMCPAHRLDILKQICQRLSQGLPVRLISTQLIEAGVDIDFPLVYRSMAGLDSIAQAAGRCNREGKLDQGLVHVFHSEHTSSEKYFAQTAQPGHEFLDLYRDDPLCQEAVKAYFNQYYYQQKSHWDKENILEEFQYTGGKELPFLFNYRKAAEKFKLIKTEQIPVFIPWNEQAKQAIADLRNEAIPLNRQLLRELQRFSVSIYDNEFRENQAEFEAHRDGQFHSLICQELHYSKDFGLYFDQSTCKDLIC